MWKYDVSVKIAKSITEFERVLQTTKNQDLQAFDVSFVSIASLDVGSYLFWLIMAKT